MKLKKQWNYIIIILLVLLGFLIIYNMNGTEHFQNNNNNNFNINNINNNENDDNDYLEYAQLKTYVASFADVLEDRIQDFKVGGTSPDVSISFTILPRSIDDIDDKSLEELYDTLSKMKSNMNYEFSVDGEDLKFVDIEVSPLEKNKLTQHERLISKFVDPKLNEQIQYLKNIKHHIPHNNNSDRFYKFDEKGQLMLQPKKENIPINTENGVLEGDNFSVVNNNIPMVEQFVPYHKRF